MVVRSRMDSQSDVAHDPRPISVPGASGVTLAEFAGMRDAGLPTELVRGEIVEVSRPGKFHGVYCSNVAELLAEWSPRRSKGQIYTNDTGLIVGRDPDTLRGPDIMFISKPRVPTDATGPGDWVDIPPELAVEVKSPSDTWTQTRAKAVEYLESGVGEVWVLDGPTRQLRVHRDPSADPLILAEGDELTSPQLPGFACKVADLLAVG